MTTVMTSFTVFVLWGDDARLYFFVKQDLFGQVDNVFYLLFFVAMVIYFCEFLANTIAKEAYKGGFFFW